MNMKAMDAGLQVGKLGTEHQAVLIAFDLHAAHGFSDALGGDGVDLDVQRFRLGGEGGAAG